MSTGAAAVFGIVTGFVVLIAILCIAIYNKLGLLRNTLQSLWSDIDGKLKKQYELIPKLVEMVRDNAPHEEAVFEKMLVNRSLALKTLSPLERAKAEHVFSAALEDLFAVAGAHPNLKAHADFVELQSQLRAIKDSTKQSRTYYNNLVKDYNAIVESFPSSMLAALFKFERAEFFEPESLTLDEGDNG